MALLLGALLSIAGVLMVALGRAATRGRLPRNHIAGIRTRVTLSSDDAWTTAHRAAGPALTTAGVPPLLTGLALLIARPSDTITAWVALAAASLTLGATAWGTVVAHRAVRARSDLLP